MNCSHTNPAMTWLLDVVKIFDPTATLDKVIFLQFGSVDRSNILDCTFVVIESLAYAWAKRKNKTTIDMKEMKAHIKSKCSMLALSLIHI